MLVLLLVVILLLFLLLFLLAGSVLAPLLVAVAVAVAVGGGWLLANGALECGGGRGVWLCCTLLRKFEREAPGRWE